LTAGGLVTGAVEAVEASSHGVAVVLESSVPFVVAVSAAEVRSAQSALAPAAVVASAAPASRAPPAAASALVLAATASAQDCPPVGVALAMGWAASPAAPTAGPLV